MGELENIKTKECKSGAIGAAFAWYNPNMETPKFSSDPRIITDSKVKNWEEGVETEVFAKAMLDTLKSTLLGNGIELNQHSKILELGSGLGIFVNYLRKNGYDAVGVDARPRGEIKDSIVAARIEQLPFKNDSFDIIIANGVFDGYVYNQDQTLMVKEIGRVLKPAGIYAASENWKESTGYENYFNILSSNKLASVYRKK